MITAHLDLMAVDGQSADLTLLALHRKPFAIFECKRVGVEEGMKKGPQSIEKAKQGAYVARSVSSLQKIRLPNGKIGGLIFDRQGEPKIAEYTKLIEELVQSKSSALLGDFVLTIGIVSNHGNWFTAEDHNKELRVLAQSYDWLVFLTDEGLGRFIQSLLLNPVADLKPAREAFLNSYGPNSVGNRFTKVKMDIRADAALQAYFAKHQDQAIKWFNVISPAGKSLDGLRRQLKLLNDKPWHDIHGDAKV